MLRSTPQQTLALIVGVDHYEYGDDWQLKGPAADALRCADWLLALGLQQSNIILCLSTKSWNSDEDVIAWKSAHGGVVQKNATREDFTRIVDSELPAAARRATAIFVFWGGHGVIDDYEKKNYLYTQDANQGLPYCISVPSLLNALRGKKLKQLTEQVIVFDACANAFSTTGEKIPPAAADFATGELQYDIKQFQMFAASPGKTAANISQRKTGRFSEALFTALKSHGTDGWPDFIQIFETARTDTNGASLEKQQPFIVIEWPGRSIEVSGQRPGVPKPLRELDAAVKLAAVQPTLLRRIYTQSLPDRHRSIGDANIHEWLADLNDIRPRGPNRPPPLIEFAERLSREKKSVAKLDAWIEEFGKGDLPAYEAMCAMLDAEAAHKGPLATLFIEFGNQELHWWIQAPNPAHCSVQTRVQLAANDRDELANVFGLITQEAEILVGDQYELRIGIIASEKLFFKQLESVQIAGDETLLAPPTPLNQLYCVTLHWQRRARLDPTGKGSTSIKSWKEALSTITPRLSSGGGANVEWLEADGDERDPIAAARTNLTSANASTVCVGFGHPVAISADMPPKEILGCLREGVPCFFWLSSAPPDSYDAQTTLCGIFAAQDAREVTRSIGKLMKTSAKSTPLSTLSIVWDEPGHLPLQQTFQSPS